MGSSLNKTEAITLANKAGVNVNEGDVVVLDLLNASSFTITGSSQLATRTIGVVLDTGGIVTGSSGLIAINGYVPQINLLSGSSIGQTVGLSSVAGKAMPHSNILVGDFGQVLSAGTTPDCILWGKSESSFPPVVIKYQETAQPTIPNLTGTIVNFDTKVTDTYNAVTVGSNWKFVVPVTGYYFVEASCLFNNTINWALTKTGLLDVYKNDVLNAHLQRIDNLEAGSNLFMNLIGSTIIQANAGDTIQIYITQQTGGNLQMNGDSNHNYITICKVA